jgi:hypothetical protein
MNEITIMVDGVLDSPPFFSSVLDKDDVLICKAA